MSRFTLIDTTARKAMQQALPTDRRRALQLLVSGAAIALSACQRPREQILPYARTSEGQEPGTTRRYATALTLGGYGRGVTAASVDGRPIKIDGNLAHPMSLGATDVFAEAAILDLYDPNRSKTARGPTGIVAWETFADTLRARLKTTNPSGAGLALLTGRITSPTQLRQIDELKQRLPNLRWARSEPVNDDAERQGSRLAFGQVAAMRPRLENADVILCLGADPLGPGPEQIALARALMSRRRPDAAMSRLYVAEGTLSQTGAKADHRIVADPAAQRAVALLLARRLGAPANPELFLPLKLARFVDAVVGDLLAHPGRGLLLIGREQPAELHALGHWINTRLKAPIDALQPIDPHPDDHAASMANLIQAMETNQISTLIVLDANPAFDVPAFTAALGRVPFTAHLGAYEDETGKATLWHAPLSHPLESWSDARSADGTAGVGQPLIRPLYDSRSPVEALAALGDKANPNARDLVRRTWTDLDENAWNLALAKGVLKDTAAKPLALGPPTYVIPPPPPAGLTLSLIPHPCLWDGRYAPNAWLQECPDPLTKEVWGSALRVSRVDARRLRLKSGDRVRISARGAEAEATVLVVSGQATGVMTLPLGGGRRAAGPIGSNLGVDVGGLRGTGSAWTVPDARLEKIGGEGRVLETQTALALDGETAVLMPIFNLADLARAQPPQTPPSQFPELPRGDHAWALAIDAQACIGCNACVVACQSENNVPVVGPEDIQAGRDMHWLRIDRYDLGSDEDPQPGFSPIPCMQCEHAPCEPVCPVEASVHDHEGLNDQVYNRCVGTRFCQANCPYKVRRFNFRDYEAGHVYGDLDVTALKAQRNPEVTVRERGVMEKCTYCVQRISAARSESERTGGPIADGALKTACQSACPTQAITFGDLNDPKARVNALRLETRHYALLEHLGTRPRTTYLARVRNPNAALEKKT